MEKQMEKNIEHELENPLIYMTNRLPFGTTLSLEGCTHSMHMRRRQNYLFVLSWFLN